MDRFDPKVDYVFKKLFGSEENKDILISFLNAALRLKDTEKISEIEILNPFINKEILTDKTSILDVKARTSASVQINIEIQLFNKYNMGKRTLYYWSKLYTSQLQSGQDYTELKKAIAINIINFSYLPTDSYHSIFELREIASGVKLTDDLQIHFLELPKLKNHRADTDDVLVKWMLFLKGVNDETMEAISMGEPAIKKALNVLDILSKDKEAKELYEIREKSLHDQISSLTGAREEGRQEGIEEGREEGKKQEKIEMAKKLLKSGSDISFISMVTGLDASEIDTLSI